MSCHSSSVGCSGSGCASLTGFFLGAAFRLVAFRLVGLTGFRVDELGVAFVNLGIIM